MAVIPRVVLAEMCTPHLDPGEGVRECVEASVLDVNGRPETAGNVDRVLVVLTDRRLVTLAWRSDADLAADGSVPIEFLARAGVEDAQVGSTLTIALTTGAVVRFAVGPAQEEPARGLAAALVAQPPSRPGPAREATTEELPVVAPSGAAPSDVESRVRLAAELAALCERTRGRILELTPGLVVMPRDDDASTYFVHVAPRTRSEGSCPRCEHANRLGAVFCDACGALL